MRTKGEMFAGVTVALVTPFRDGEVDWDTLGKLVDWHVEQGTDCLAPVGTTGESPTLDHEEHERVIAAVVRAGRAAASRSWPAPAPTAPREAIRLTQVRQEGRRRRRAHGRPLLQQADAGGLLSATSPPSPRRWTCRSCFTTSPAAPARTSCPRRSPAWPKLPTDRRRQGGDRLARPGVADRGAVRPDDPVRRRQPDAAADEHRRPGRGVGGRQHRAARHEGAGDGVRCGAVSARPRSGTASCSRCAATCSAWRPIRSRSRRAMKLLGRGHGRDAAADVSAGRRRRGPGPANAPGLWTHALK